MLDLSTLDFTKGQGLVTVVAQDARTGEVLMVAHADREALEKTLATGKMHYRSRTRGLWLKGETSGNFQAVVSLEKDCDGDAVLARVEPAGPACHTGARTCFVAPTGHGQQSAPGHGQQSAPGHGQQSAPGHPERSRGAQSEALAHLARTLAQRASSAPAPGEKPSYTQRLLADRNLRLKKLGEETAELITACADGDVARAVEECADVLYHSLVALQALGATLEDVQRVLAARAR